MVNLPIIYSILYNSNNVAIGILVYKINKNVIIKILVNNEQI